MQAVEMMRGTKAHHLILFLMFFSITRIYSFPLQVLPSIPGYIPVYIRHGDQPLEEINPALAEAFHEESSLSKSIDLDNISNSPDISLEEDEVNKYNIYPIHVTRQVNSVDATELKSEKTTEESVENREKEKYRGKHRRRILPKAVVKLNPLREEEKAALEKMQLEVTEEIKDSNNMQDSNLKFSDLQKEKLYYENTGETIESNVTKIETVKTEAEAESKLDLLSIKNNSKESQNSPGLSSTAEIGEIIKEKPIPHILANVVKLTPSLESLQKDTERIENETLQEKSK